MNELEHKPKPSTGSKTPTVLKDSLVAASEATNMADNIKSTTLNSIIESQAKARILNQLNPSEIVQAVSKHFQQNRQSLQLPTTGGAGGKSRTDLTQQ